MAGVACNGHFKVRHFFGVKYSSFDWLLISNALLDESKATIRFKRSRLDKRRNALERASVLHYLPTGIHVNQLDLALIGLPSAILFCGDRTLHGYGYRTIKGSRVPCSRVI